MSQYEINTTGKFLKDVEEISFWIFVTNVEYSENLAETKLSQFESDLVVLKKRFKSFQSPAKKLRPKVYASLPSMMADIPQGGVLIIAKRQWHSYLFWI